MSTVWKDKSCEIQSKLRDENEVIQSTHKVRKSRNIQDDVCVNETVADNFEMYEMEKLSVKTENLLKE